MPMTKQLWSLNGLATELGKDRRTLGNALSTVPPDGHIGGEKRWYLTTATRALDRARQTMRAPADDPFSDLLLDRLANKHRSGQLESFSVEEIAEVSRATPADVLRWLRAGMPFQLEGDWKTGKGFRIPLSWALDWTGYAAHVGREDLRDKLGLGT